MLSHVNYDEFAANNILRGSNLTKIIILFHKTVNERDTTTGRIKNVISMKLRYWTFERLATATCLIS